MWRSYNAVEIGTQLVSWVTGFASSEVVVELFAEGVDQFAYSVFVQIVAGVALDTGLVFEFAALHV